MFRNYAITALRNLARNKLHAGISIFGLAIGICAALLMSLVLRNQLTYDTFIPGYERTYAAVAKATSPGHPPDYFTSVDDSFAAQARLVFPQIEAATRIEGRAVTLRHGQIDTNEWFYWADPNVFDLLSLPAIAGDLKTALTRPDGIVLTRSIAHRLFGHDDPIGETLQIITRNTPLPNPDPTKPLLMVPSGTYPMTVTAVIDDLPDNGTSLESGVFASALASFSDFNIYGAAFRGSQYFPVTTYLRLAPGASIDRLRAAMPAFMQSYFNPQKLALLQIVELPPNGKLATYDFVRLDRVHLNPNLNPGIDGLLTMTTLSGTLILLIACINFVNLSTARSARRALEVGIRKVSGAQRRALIVQFLGESLIYVMIATTLAILLTEIALPYVNATLDVGAVFDYWRHPMLVAGLSVALLLLGVLTGLYPAFILSAFKPAAVLKGQFSGSRKSNRLRHVLVIAQFAILIGLALAAIVVYQQREFATRQALRMDTDQVLYVGDMPQDQTCDGTLMTAWRALPGVRAAACGDGFGGLPLPLKLKDGTSMNMGVARVDPGLLKLYGVKALAGRLFNSQDPCLAVVNEEAVHRLGYASPAAVIDQILDVQKATICEGSPVRIIGVVPDFSIFSVDQPIDPTIYVNEHDIPSSTHAHLKLTGRDIPETVAAIDHVWTATGQKEPIAHSFVNDFVQNRYLFVLREAQGFGVFAGVAMLLACLGLVGLAVSTAERRTKEIGIRKAMGANSVDVLRLLTWEFAQPVLIANLIAWPIAYYEMKHWLSGFIRHVDLSPWIFLFTGGLAVLIALATVSVQSVMTARAKPVAALRYE